MVTVSPLFDESRTILAALTERLAQGDEAIRLLAFLDEAAGSFDVQPGERFSDAVRREYLRLHPPPALPQTGPGLGPQHGSGT